MKRTLKWLVPLVMIVLLAVVVARAVSSRRAVPPPVTAAPAALELAATDIATVRRVELTRTLDISGGLKAVNSAQIKARIAAEVKTLAVREGDTVRAGQVVVTLDTAEVDLKWRQAEQNAAASRAQLDIARRALDNNKALVAQGFISPTALDTSVSNEAAAQATFQAAQAAVDLARKARADAVLTAPIGGLVSQRLVQPGERVAIDTRLLEIVDLSRLEMEAALAPEDVSAVKIGAVAQLQIDGIGTPVNARVVRINPSAQTGSRTVMAYLAVEAHPALRQGLFVRGKVELDRQSVLAVPASAFRDDQARPYLLVVDGDRAVVRAVTPGPLGEADGQTLRSIGNALPEGTRVLGSAVGTVRDGSPVKLVAAAAPLPSSSPASGPGPSVPSASAASAAR